MLGWRHSGFSVHNQVPVCEQDAEGSNRLAGYMVRAVAAEDWKMGGVALNQIRILIATNLTLGILNIAIAILGRNM